VPAVYLRSVPEFRPQDIILRDATQGPVLVSGTCVSSSRSNQLRTDVVLRAGRARPKDVTLRAFFLWGRLRVRPTGTSVATSTSSGSVRVRLRVTGTAVSVSTATGSAITINPTPPIPFVPGLQTPSYDGPGGHEARGARYKESVEAKPFPMDKQRQPVSGFKPKRMGFKARRTKPPFRPMS
jgi:hypothetical protein